MAKPLGSSYTGLCPEIESISPLKEMYSLSLRLKDLLGPATRVKKKKKMTKEMYMIIIIQGRAGSRDRLLSRGQGHLAHKKTPTPL